MHTHPLPENGTLLLVSHGYQGCRTLSVMVRNPQFLVVIKNRWLWVVSLLDLDLSTDSVHSPLTASGWSLTCRMPWLRPMYMYGKEMLDSTVNHSACSTVSPEAV